MYTRLKIENVQFYGTRETTEYPWVSRLFVRRRSDICTGPFQFLYMTFYCVSTINVNTFIFFLTLFLILY